MATRTTAAEFLAALPAGSVCAVVGLPASGKSHAVRTADSRLAFPRRVVFDPYFQIALAQAKRRKGATLWPGSAVTPLQLLRNASGGVRGRWLDRADCRLTVAPTSLRPIDLARDFRDVAEVCWETSGVDLILEEAGLYLHHPEAYDLLTRYSSGAQHAGARVILVLQSLSRLPIQARRCLTALVCFAVGEPRDIDEIRKRCGSALADEAQAFRLGDFRCFCWRQGQHSPPRHVRGFTRSTPTEHLQ
jgi:hypothetical protein